MKKKFIVIILTLITIPSCQSDYSAKEKELELKEKELNLKEKELELKAKEKNVSKEIYSNEISNDNSKTNSNNKLKRTKVESPIIKTEKELQEELYKKEASNPLKYLSAKYTYKTNLAANTIIEGRIYNRASLAGFKNVNLTVYFYSKTDVLLGKENFTIMEFFPSGKSVYFRHKITGWWSKVSYSNYEIISAQPY